MIRLMLVATLALFSTACSPIAQACTEIGCTDQLALTIKPDSLEFAPGSYALTVSFDGEAQPACEFDVETACGGDGPCITNQNCDVGLGQLTAEELRIVYQTTPTELTYTFTLGTASLAGETVQPDYADVQPNGEGCDPICKQGAVDVDL